MKFVDVMYANALQVLRGCDKVLDAEVTQWRESRSLARLGTSAFKPADDRRFHGGRGLS